MQAGEQSVCARNGIAVTIAVTVLLDTKTTMVMGCVSRAVKRRCSLALPASNAKICMVRPAVTAQQATMAASAAYVRRAIKITTKTAPVNLLAKQRSSVAAKVTARTAAALRRVPAKQATVVPAAVLEIGRAHV